MPINLRKGGNFSLTKSDPGLKKILVGLGWDAKSTDAAPFDLDASVFMLAENGRVRRDDDFIFYNNLCSSCGSIEHTGDNRTGAGEGDDEALRVDLERVPVDVKSLAVCVTIDQAQARRQNFGQVSAAFMRIVDLSKDMEIARFDLSEDYSTDTSMIFGEVYRHNGEWKFKAVGQGLAGGLENLCARFGVAVA